MTDRKRDVRDEKAPDLDRLVFQGLGVTCELTVRTRCGEGELERPPPRFGAAWPSG